MNDLCFVTGGAGFIGGNFILRWLNAEQGKVVNIDKMTYAASPLLLEELEGNEAHIHERVDIADMDRIRPLFRDYKPRYVVHFAGESHVDRSISDPVPFLHTNIQGTYTLLEAAREYYRSLERFDKHEFRFIHVSTDEVFGSLEIGEETSFTERSRYEPSTPYAATKAASDHLVQAWWKTYGLPTLLVNCSNNYGPRQSPEKLVPKVIHRLLKGIPIPVYGDGRHLRDWLYVGDCCEAVRAVVEKGRVGERYNIGGNSEKSVLEVVDTIDRLMTGETGSERGKRRLQFEPDRLGNDRRYSLDTEKIERELGWKASVTFETGMKETVDWYLEHHDWLQQANHRLTTT